MPDSRIEAYRQLLKVVADILKQNDNINPNGPNAGTLPSEWRQPLVKAANKIVPLDPDWNKSSKYATFEELSKSLMSKGLAYGYSPANKNIWGKPTIMVRLDADLGDHDTFPPYVEGVEVYYRPMSQPQAYA